MTLNSKQNSVDDVVLNGILTVVKNSDWFGTMTELRNTLSRTLGREFSKVLPRSASALRVVINRVVNRLRSRSVSVKFGRTPDHVRTRYVKFVAR